jgi:hypothetical protein
MPRSSDSRSFVARDELRERLARSSHEVYERHCRELGKPESEIFKEVHPHDYDRADDAIRALEELGVWSEPHEG